MKLIKKYPTFDHGRLIKNVVPVDNIDDATHVIIDDKIIPKDEYLYDNQ